MIGGQEEGIKEISQIKGNPGGKRHARARFHSATAVDSNLQLAPVLQQIAHGVDVCFSIKKQRNLGCHRSRPCVEGKRASMARLAGQISGPIASPAQHVFLGKISQPCRRFACFALIFGAICDVSSRINPASDSQSAS